MKVLLIHWRPEEAENGLALLAKAGHSVRIYSGSRSINLGFFEGELPDVALISLERQPAHGRAIGHWLRSTKTTSHVPIVFVGGAEEKVAAARAMFPDALFCAWRGVRGAVREARKRPQFAQPQPTCAGKPLWRKYDVREGDRVLQVGGPEPTPELLGSGMPHEVRWVWRKRWPARPGQPDLVVLHVENEDQLQAHFSAAVELTADGRPLWLCHPKKSSNLPTDLDRESLSSHWRAAGWTDVKVCRVDETWTGNMLRRRLRK